MIKVRVKWFIFGIFLLTLINSGICLSGGRCYMMSQAKCEQAWTNLWIANAEKQINKICQYFGDVHSCTMDYMPTCEFKPEEKELYESDIVRIYTRKPYSCELIGGNMRYKGVYNSSRINNPELCLILMLVFLLVHIK